MNIPVLHVRAKTIPETWELAVLTLHAHGTEIAGQHGREGDPPTLDCTMTMEVQQPMLEPRIHKSLPVGLDGLGEYVNEVIHGLHDERHDGWGYSYWRRLRKYLAISILPIGKVTPRTNCGLKAIGVDQINVMIERLCQCHHTRRAQAITWMPGIDNDIADPPCLQRVWARLLPDEKGHLWLNMNLHWRSRDALKAAFMNLFAMSELQRFMAESISERLERPVFCGRLVDISDSFHLVGAYLAEGGDYDKFAHSVDTRPFEDRVWNSEVLKR